MVTVNVLALPMANVARCQALVIAAGSSTVSVNGWLATWRAAAHGHEVQRVAAARPAAGVPASVAVPLPLSVNVTPAGSVPPTLSVALAPLLVVTLNVPAAPR